MRYLFLSIVLACLALSSSGCSHTSSSAGNVVDITKTDFSKLGKMKKGMDCRNTLLGIFSWGENNLANIVRGNKMKKVTYLENEFHFYLVFWKNCLVAYGR